MTNEKGDNTELKVASREKSTECNNKLSGAYTGDTNDTKENFNWDKLK